MTRFVFDAGPLIAFERNDRRVGLLVSRIKQHRETITVPVGVLGQVWRDGSRQARLARFFRSDSVFVEPLDEESAREAAVLCGLRGTNDLIDATVARCAMRRRATVVTSDPDDIYRLEPTLRIIPI